MVSGLSSSPHSWLSINIIYLNITPGQTNNYIGYINYYPWTNCQLNMLDITIMKIQLVLMNCDDKWCAGGVNEFTSRGLVFAWVRGV